MIFVSLLCTACAYVGWQSRIVRERKAWLRANAQETTLAVGKLHEVGDKAQRPGLVRSWLGDEEQESLVVFDPKPGELEVAAGLFPEADVIKINTRYGWYQTRGNDASQVLTTKLSIPGLFDEKIDDISIARYMRLDTSGMIYLPPERFYDAVYADGRNEKGGFGYGGGTNVDQGEEDEDDTVILNVNYHWTTREQIKGQLKEKVPAKIGVPLDVKLPCGCHLQVSWRAVPQP